MKNRKNLIVISLSAFIGAFSALSNEPTLFEPKKSKSESSPSVVTKIEDRDRVVTRIYRDYLDSSGGQENWKLYSDLLSMDYKKDNLFPMLVGGNHDFKSLLDSLLLATNQTKDDRNLWLRKMDEHINKTIIANRVMMASVNFVQNAKIGVCYINLYHTGIGTKQTEVILSVAAAHEMAHCLGHRYKDQDWVKKLSSSSKEKLKEFYSLREIDSDTPYVKLLEESMADIVAVFYLAPKGKRNELLKKLLDERKTNYNRSIKHGRCFEGYDSHRLLNRINIDIEVSFPEFRKLAMDYLSSDKLVDRYLEKSGSICRK